MLLTFVWLISGIGTPTVHAQQSGWVSDNGVLHITQWPDNVLEKGAMDSLRVHSEIFPSIDTLTIGYGYHPAEAQPFLTFAVEWKPGAYYFLDGEQYPWEELDAINADIEIESLRIRADVLVDGESVSKVDFVVDSLMLAPFPALFSQEVATLTWDTVFPGIADSTARKYFTRDLKLSHPEIVGITFAYYGDEPVIADERRTSTRHRKPSRRTVYGPDIGIYIDFPIFVNRRPRYIPPRTAEVPRANEPRGEQVGRGGNSDRDRRSNPRTTDDRSTRDADTDDTPRTSGDRTRDADRAGAADDESGKRTSTRSTRKKDDEDDDEDDDELLPAAIVGVAAVAAVAVAGGTVGYYGNSANAPIGLTAGYVQPEGGFLLQAAVNEAVINRSGTQTERLLGRVVGFFDAFEAPIQPALGFGLLVSELDGDYDYDFSMSLGLVGNFDNVILLTGYDVTNGGLDVGLAFNFRAK